MKVFVLVSGGVDSTVTFTLLNKVIFYLNIFIKILLKIYYNFNKALGNDRVYGLFIDNGLLRKNEYEFVDSSIKNLGYNNFNSYDGSELFLSRLNGVYEPEAKRKIIGDTFIDV